MRTRKPTLNLLGSLRLLAALALIPVAAAASVTSSDWVGRTFPGFFLMANRVVPSVGLAHWSGVRDGSFYQAAVITVDGHPVKNSAEVYDLVDSKAPGTSIRYTLAKEGRLYDRSIPSMRFSTYDYAAIFAAYLLNGAVYAIVAICAALGAASQVSYALLSLGLSAGLFALTGADLYHPHDFFRLHALAEVFFPASLIHLALVFPKDRLGKDKSLAAIPYLVTLPLAAAYEILLFDPAAYSVIHNAASICLGLAGCAFLAAVAHGYWTEKVAERRRPITLVAIGALAGLGLPAVVMTVSGLSGGTVPVNLSAFTAFLFPLSLAYVTLRYRIVLPSLKWQGLLPSTETVKQ